MRRTIVLASLVVALATGAIADGATIGGTHYRRVRGPGPRYLVVKGSGCLTRKFLTTLVLANGGWQPQRHRVVLICVAP